MSGRPERPKKKKILLSLTEESVEFIDKLVKSGVYSNRSHFMQNLVGGFWADLKNRAHLAAPIGSLPIMVSFVYYTMDSEKYNEI